MDKDTALNIIINNFKTYKQEFVNKNVLFVFREKTGNIKGFETTYESGNSKNLTIGYMYTSYPITLLNMKPANAVLDKYSVLFTLRKDISDSKYKEVTYWKEGISKNTLKKIELPFKNHIDFSSIK